MKKEIEILSVIADLKERKSVINLAYYLFEYPLEQIIKEIKRYKIKFKRKKIKLGNGLEGVTYAFASENDEKKGEGLLILLCLKVYLAKEENKGEFDTQREIIESALKEFERVGDCTLKDSEMIELWKIKDKPIIGLKRSYKGIEVQDKDWRDERKSELETIRMPRI